MILRLYEAKRADTDCELTVSLPVHSAFLCDMLENIQKPLPLSDGGLPLRYDTRQYLAS